mmetsp:Transcript_23189/g.46104  ORF Transcript_23189/g.46104 Transcript_23189/m.46104 type:complete len:317 (+) Transcript_23189:723-1673(+)
MPPESIAASGPRRSPSTSRCARSTESAGFSTAATAAVSSSSSISPSSSSSAPYSLAGATDNSTLPLPPLSSSSSSNIKATSAKSGLPTKLARSRSSDDGAHSMHGSRPASNTNERELAQRYRRALKRANALRFVSAASLPSSSSLSPLSLVVVVVMLLLLLPSPLLPSTPPPLLLLLLLVSLPSPPPCSSSSSPPPRHTVSSNTALSMSLLVRWARSCCVRSRLSSDPPKSSSLPPHTSSHMSCRERGKGGSEAHRASASSGLTSGGGSSLCSSPSSCGDIGGGDGPAAEVGGVEGVGDCPSWRGTDARLGLVARG